MQPTGANPARRQLTLVTKGGAEVVMVPRTVADASEVVKELTRPRTQPGFVDFGDAVILTSELAAIRVDVVRVQSQEIA